jgi:hypothetical protein
LELVTAFFVFDLLHGEEAGLMHSINGYIFGNLKGLILPYGKKVRWHVLAMGNEVDLHTVPSDLLIPSCSPRNKANFLLHRGALPEGL